MRENEDKEDREQECHGFLDSAEVQDDQEEKNEDLCLELDVCHAWREETEDGVAAGRDRDGDGQDVVHDERTARDHTETRPEELRRDEVASASPREMLDQQAVCERDDEHRPGYHQGQEDREIG